LKPNGAQQTTHLTFTEGVLVRYYKHGWHVAYFERYEPPVRARFAILIPPMLGKARIKMPIADVEPVQP
jgi:hypothetical protein